MDVPAPLLGGIVEPEHPLQGPLLNETVKDDFNRRSVIPIVAKASARGPPRQGRWPLRGLASPPEPTARALARRPSSR